MRGTRLEALIVLAAVAVLLPLVVIRAGSDVMRRPLELDEIVTIVGYTWVSVTPDGDHRQIGHIDDYYAVPRPSSSQLAMGVYCGAGRWAEPNNHVLNSLLVGLALAVGRRDEYTARTPSLLAGLTFAVLIFYLCYVELGWRWAAPLVAAWAWFCPYVTHFSQTARGYGWMLALQVLLVILAYRVSRRPTSVLLSGVMAAAAALSVINVVSMSVDLVLPLYLAMLVRRLHDDSPPPGESPRSRAYYKAVVAQLLGVGGVVLVFYLSHLPSVYQSARTYGLAFGSTEGLVTNCHLTADYLFPTTAWKAFGVLGAAGCVLLLRSRRWRFVGLLIALTVAVSAAHFLAGRKFPYPRAAGYLLPLAMLGVAFLVECWVRLFESLRHRLAAWSLPVGATVALLVPAGPGTPAPTEARLMEQLRAEPAGPSGPAAYYITGEHIGPAWVMYRPDRDKLPPRIRSGTDVNLYVTTARQPGGGWGVELAGRREGACKRKWDPTWWGASPVGEPVDDNRIFRLDGKTWPLGKSIDGAQRAVAFWYPDPESVRVRSEPILAHANHHGLNYCVERQRVQVKLDQYEVLKCLVVVIDGPESLEAFRSAVTEGSFRFGGEVVVFVPTVLQD